MARRPPRDVHPRPRRGRRRRATRSCSGRPHRDRCLPPRPRSRRPPRASPGDRTPPACLAALATASEHMNQIARATASSSGSMRPVRLSGTGDRCDRSRSARTREPSGLRGSSPRPSSASWSRTRATLPRDPAGTCATSWSSRATDRCATVPRTPAEQHPVSGTTAVARWSARRAVARWSGAVGRWP